MRNDDLVQWTYAPDHRNRAAVREGKRQSRAAGVMLVSQGQAG